MKNQTPRFLPAPISRLVRRIWRKISPTERRRRLQRKEEKRNRFLGQEWQHGKTLSTRQYASYEEYLAHQSDKLGKVESRLKAHSDESLDVFRRRFESCGPLSDKRVVVCLGARLGGEVQALIELGHFAVGIDLNPGENNARVMYGDFHHLVFGDASVDAVYSNALDHAFDLEKIAREVHRVLRPGGIFVTDILAGYEEGFAAGEFEATHWARASVLAEELARLGPFDLVEHRQLAEPSWSQWVLQKAT